jgi:pimeloyl-ACP methyl ester carboxylesterase
VASLSVRARLRLLLLAAAVLVLAAAGALLAPGRARAAAKLAPCGRTAGLECTDVSVPIDRTGAFPGTLSLHVEVLPATPPARGVFFLIAGGPGQGSARSFDLGNPSSAAFIRAILPGYTLVAVDNRGTGASALIDCPGLQKAASAAVERQAALARDCAAIIGPQRVFYATRDHAEDLESVRQALGFRKIGLFGVSYGTKLALAYALAHPDRVERLLLDSVVPTDFPDPFAQDVLTNMPAALTQLCADGRCRGATTNFPGDVAVVANRAQARPVRGHVLMGGKPKTVRMTGEDLLGTIVDLDLNPGLAAELPAAVHAARKGSARPLLRLVELDRQASATPAVDLSFGLFAATNCADGEFPWTPTTPVSERAGILQAAIDALAPGSFGPFGKWAARFGTAYFCELWPAPAGRTPLAPGPFPDVPVLAVSGGLDLRTPTANAVAVLQHFPHGQLLVTPGVGHSVFGTDLSLCSQREIRYWALGLIARSTCPRAPALVKTLTAFPKVVRREPPRATVAVAAKTVREAQAAWAIGPKPLSGLYGGTLRSAPQRAFRLAGYSIAPGIRVSGRLRYTPGKFPLPFKGTITVSGPKASPGKLQVSPNALSGVVGGKRVSAPF